MSGNKRTLYLHCVLKGTQKECIQSNREWWRVNRWNTFDKKRMSPNNVVLPAFYKIIHSFVVSWLCHCRCFSFAVRLWWSKRESQFIDFIVAWRWKIYHYSYTIRITQEWAGKLTTICVCVCAFINGDAIGWQNTIPSLNCYFRQMPSVTRSCHDFKTFLSLHPSQIESNWTKHNNLS